MTTELEINGVHYETVDINIVPDAYVTWIVDIWQGHRHDPAVSVTRYIGVWDAAVLEDEQGYARDPDFTKFRPDHYYSRDGDDINPKPMHWAVLEVIKQSDREAKKFRDEQESMMPPPEDSKRYYSTHSQRRQQELYQRFMEAVDIVAQHPEDETAWEAIRAWQQYRLQATEEQGRL